MCMFVYPVSAMDPRWYKQGWLYVRRALFTPIAPAGYSPTDDVKSPGNLKGYFVKITPFSLILLFS